ERRDERLDERVRPADEEPDRGVERLRRVGVERAGRGQVLGELPDRQRHEERADQRDHDRERRGAAGERDPERDREGGRRGRRHVRDRLEYDLSQPDGLTGQSLRRCGCGRRRSLHRTTSSTFAGADSAKEDRNAPPWGTIEPQAASIRRGAAPTWTTLA